MERGIERKGGYRTWPWSTTGVHRWKKEWQARRREKNNVAGHPENKEEKGGSWDDEKREREREKGMKEYKRRTSCINWERI